MTKMPQDGDAYQGDYGNPFPSVQDKFALSEQDQIKMAAPNKQPARRGGAAGVHTHAPFQSGQPASSFETGNAGPGQGRTAPVVSKGTGKNKNRLH
jgi:hypothetical protein